ncbi:MAG: iron-containing alcohol dehydrogenase [Pseudomonadota bacterium]
MTLITYPTRVHFADGVLEEALHSELERVKASTVLLVCAAELAEGELIDRIVSGLPTRLVTEQALIGSGRGLRAIAAEVARRPVHPDVILSFGSSRAVELGRKMRFAVDQAGSPRPALFAVPAVDGMPDPCTRKLESNQAGLPSVVICDPTVISDAGTSDSMRSAVMSLIRCVEAYLSLGYNPPADGMALDGLSRCLTNLGRIGRERGLELHREVMAAGLNAFLSQEKGVGPAQTMTASLLKDDEIDKRAAIARLVLPGIMQAREMDNDKADVLRKVLSDADEPLADAIRRVLARAEMPRSLADVGVRADALDAAAKSVAGSAGLTFRKARSVLDDVYEGA